MSNISDLRKRIVAALIKGEPVDGLERQLRQAKVDELEKTEMVELKRIAEQRLGWEKKVVEIKGRIGKQSEAVKRYLVARDAILAPIEAMIAQVKALAAMEQEATAYRACDFSEDTRALPLQFGADLRDPTLGHRHWTGFDTTAQAAKYLEDAHDLLSGMYTFDYSPSSSEPLKDDLASSDVHDAVEFRECNVCQHKDRTAIDLALQANQSLRDIESQFGVSKSSLHRHKQHLPGGPSQPEIEAGT